MSEIQLDREEHIWLATVLQKVYKNQLPDLDRHPPPSNNAILRLIEELVKCRVGACETVQCPESAECRITAVYYRVNIDENGIENGALTAEEIEKEYKKRVYKDVRSEIDAFKDEKIREERQSRLEHEYKLNKILSEEQKTLKVLEQKLRRATERDYAEWLFGYIQNGGKPTHYYDYDLPRRKFYLATQDFEIRPLCGSSAVNIIVPKDINFLGGELGNNKIYLLKGYECLGGLVPVYKDV